MKPQLKPDLMDAQARLITGALPMYVVFYHTTDYPNRFVVRKFILAPKVNRPLSTDWAHVCDTYQEIEKHLPPGLVRFPREEEDEPTIVETWV